MILDYISMKFSNLMHVAEFLLLVIKIYISKSTKNQQNKTFNKIFSKKNVCGWLNRHLDIIH